MPLRNCYVMLTKLLLARKWMYSHLFFRFIKMSLWSEVEFQRVALTTKLTERTLVACHDVLVDGIPGVQAAARNKIFPAQISRAISTLKDKQLSMVEEAKALNDDSVLLKFTAHQVAKTFMSEYAVIVDAEPGQSYDGRIVAFTPGFLIQKIGRSAVVHDLGKFEETPTLNSAILISYPNNGMKAVCSQSSLMGPRQSFER